MLTVAPPNERNYHMKITVSTEIWSTRKGTVAKAVTRKSNGTFTGATNQTKGVSVAKVVRPRVTLVGR
jgi:hypothetical protein